MSLPLNPWDWEYYPIKMTYDANNCVTAEDKDVVKTMYQVWDHTCMRYGSDFDTYDLAKAYAEHLCINHQYKSSVYTENHAGRPEYTPS